MEFKPKYVLSVAAMSLILLLMMSMSYTKNYASINYKHYDSSSEWRQYVAAFESDKISFPGATILPVIDQREDLGIVLEHEGKTSGVEVGVLKGEFAKQILTRWPTCKTYILIDAWQHQENYKDDANFDQNVQNSNYQKTKQTLSAFEKTTNLTYMRMFSTEAVKKIPDNSMDFVYLDARHDYRAVCEELELFWPKLKRNGIFAGHDFVDAHEEPARSGQDWCLFANGERCTKNRAVKAAVQEFARKVHRQVVATKRVPAWASWYIRK